MALTKVIPSLTDSAYFSGFHASGSLFDRTSASFGDFNPDGSSTFTTRFSNNLGTVSSAQSAGQNLPGVVFTPVYDGIYQVTATCRVRGQTAGTNLGLQFADASNTSLTIDYNLNDWTSTAGYNQIVTISCVVSGSAGVSQTVKMQGKISSGTLNVSDNFGIEWIISRIG